jgi:ribosomal protein L32
MAADRTIVRTAATKRHTLGSFPHPRENYRTSEICSTSQAFPKEGIMKSLLTPSWPPPFWTACCTTQPPSTSRVKVSGSRRNARRACLDMLSRQPAVKNRSCQLNETSHRSFRQCMSFALFIHCQPENQRAESMQ